LIVAVVLTWATRRCHHTARSSRNVAGKAVVPAVGSVQSHWQRRNYPYFAVSPLADWVQKKGQKISLALIAAFGAYHRQNANSATDENVLNIPLTRVVVRLRLHAVYGLAPQSLYHSVRIRFNIVNKYFFAADETESVGAGFGFCPERRTSLNGLGIE
jgi:hypothetical protein